MKKLLIICAVGTLFVLVNMADANTIVSSTMIFRGGLTSVGNAYTGTIAMIDESAISSSYGDGVAGYDVYGKNGAWATYDTVGNGQSYQTGQIVDHDAYTTAGGWGSYYDPDCADWYNYQLRLTEDHWYLEYNSNVGNDGIFTGAVAAPMSGPMNWTTLVATEADTGAYYSGMGTAESPGYAASFAASKGQSTAGAWDMDWSWGSDYVPLETPYFNVFVTPLSGGNYEVALVPVPEPATMALIGLGSVSLLCRKRKV